MEVGVLVFSVNVLFPKVVEKFFQLKHHILVEKKLLKAGDLVAKLK